ncbi:MAG: nucleotide disphospho-sugar-binding domain-containing protein [Polyangiales bacterium]
MARILVATVPLTGHFQPMLHLVQALVERGHEITWYAATKFAPAIAKCGARHAPMRASIDWDDTNVEVALPMLRRKRGLARVRAQLRAMFIDPMLEQLRDLEALADAAKPDVIIADQAHLGAALLHETRGIPWAGLGISALVIPSVDTAPFGSALPPARDHRDHPKNRMLNWMIHRVLFGGVTKSYRRARIAAGLTAGTGTYFDILAPQLFLQPTIPAFEYPRSDLPPQVHFVGPLVPRRAPDRSTFPAWWPELEAARAAGVPIVLVTQGTLATDPRELIGPSLRGLAGEDMLVVATTGRPVAGPEAMGLRAYPANARVEPFVPYHALLPLTSAIVTNGGYGGVQLALHHGVPLVVAGGSEEKPEIAARVAWCGAGIDLRTGRPSPKKIRAAVTRLRDEPAFKARVTELAAEISTYNAAARGAELVEELIATRSAVVRHGSTRALLEAA